MSKENFFDAIVTNENDETSYEIYSQYIEAKAKSVLQELLAETQKPVRLKGNDILVNGKKVGTISHDTDKDEGISYTSEEGKKSKYESIEKLFTHLTKEHKLDEASELHVLSTRKKGTEKWHPQFSGSRKECTDEWRDTKGDWNGHEHKIHKHDDSVAESLAETGDKALASKSEKDFKSFKNDDALKLTSQASHEDNADHSDAEKDHAAAEKKKAESRKKIDKAAKTFRKIDWK